MSASERLSKLSLEIASRSLDALLITAPANVRYLTGFSGSNGVLLLPAAGEGGFVRPLFVTDFRYESQSEAEVGGVAPGCARAIASGDLLEALAVAMGAQPENASAGVAEPPRLRPAAGESQGGGEDGAQGERGGGASVGEIEIGLPAGAKLGFDDRHLTVARHRRLAELLDQVCLELSAAGGVVEMQREVKDEGEQRQIAAAAALADQALLQTLERGLIGRTEREVAIDLEAQMIALGAQAASFPTIVASGEHGALPHAQPRDLEIRAGELVTIDWGAILDGYCSDCTRTYAAGEPTDRGREIYELVLRAQLAGLAALVPGRSGRAVDAEARAVIEQAGYGERFGHGLGHGVGLEIHEGPRLSKTASEEPLRAGTVVTVEPGVYLPGELGVRIEDLVVLTDEGVRNLSSLPKDLAVVL